MALLPLWPEPVFLCIPALYQGISSALKEGPWSEATVVKVLRLDSKTTLSYIGVPFRPLKLDKVIFKSVKAGSGCPMPCVSGTEPTGDGRFTGPVHQASEWFTCISVPPGLSPLLAPSVKHLDAMTDRLWTEREENWIRVHFGHKNLSDSPDWT